MTKSELTEALSEELNRPIRTSSNIVNTVLETMTEALVNGERIELRGFGSFSVKQYDSYTGKNPKTGKKIKVEAKKLPFFKVGKELRKAVNAGSNTK